MSILNSINRVICLTLDKRIEIATELKEQCASKCLDVELFIAGGGAKPVKYDYIDSDDLPPRTPYTTTYPTWLNRPNAFNAWQCHREIFKRCKKGENLLLLEDDSELSDDFNELIEKTNPFFTKNKWDMIYLGCYHFNSKRTDDENVMRMNGGGGFHGVIIKANIIENLLRWDPIGPYDWITGQYLHQYHPCYAIYPSIINQRSGFSYVEGSNLDKPDRYKLATG